MAEAKTGASEFDRRMMAAALRLGRRNLGHTAPNPAVGAIIVRETGDGPVIVGRGWTAAGGRPHAEANALAMAGEAARGATVYVTLEPCSHQGRAGPCAQALIAAGVGRVVSAMEDPDPRTAGGGHQLLTLAGIDVVTGVLEAEARLAHAGHILRVTQGRPKITLKLAVSADGMIGRNTGERMMITEKPSLDRVQAMRAEADAVMVGINTALVDDPRLTVRHPGMAPHSPVRIVLDAKARLPLTSNLVTTAREVPVWVMVGEAASADARKGLEDAGVTVIEIAAARAGIDMPKVLKELGARGLTRVLAEGGSRIASSLLNAGAADEVVLFRADVVVGPDGIRAFAGQALSAVERSPRYRLVESAQVGKDQMRRYLRVA
jgi:diaminohydroxyphosphoribosylaminopyrimidine deaminase/5-amino-6-(5-phosphoribosylamino)uracil reductase